LTNSKELTGAPRQVRAALASRLAGRRVAAKVPKLAGFLKAVSEVESLRPVLANVDSVYLRAIGIGPVDSFRAAIRGGPVLTFPSLRGPAFLSSNILLMIRETWADGTYTPRGFEIQDGDSVVDIGANVGVFTLYAALRSPHGSVVASEPVPEIYDFLRANVELNHLPNVKAFQYGVLDRPGHGHIWCDARNVGGHSVFRARVRTSQTRQVPVEFITLEQLLRKGRVDRVNLLKLDCEGSEYPIVLHATDETLDKIDKIALEYHLVDGQEHAPADLATRLTAAGFRVTTGVSDGDAGMMWAQRECE